MPNLIIQTNKGERINYDKILFLCPSKHGFQKNEFCVVAILDTDNKANNKVELFNGTKKEVDHWLKWFDHEVSIPTEQDSFWVLKYPEMSRIHKGVRRSLDDPDWEAIYNASIS